MLCPVIISVSHFVSFCTVCPCVFCLCRASMTFRRVWFRWGCLSLRLSNTRLKTSVWAWPCSPSPTLQWTWTCRSPLLLKKLGNQLFSTAIYCYQSLLDVMGNSERNCSDLPFFPHLSRTIISYKRFIPETLNRNIKQRNFLTRIRINNVFKKFLDDFNSRTVKDSHITLYDLKIKYLSTLEGLTCGLGSELLEPISLSVTQEGDVSNGSYYGRNWGGLLHQHAGSCSPWSFYCRVSACSFTGKKSFIGRFLGVKRLAAILLQNYNKKRLVFTILSIGRAGVVFVWQWLCWWHFFFIAFVSCPTSRCTQCEMLWELGLQVYILAHSHKACFEPYSPNQPASKPVS